jgi:DNA-binding PadR family transcriptional regulator
MNSAQKNEDRKAKERFPLVSHSRIAVKSDDPTHKQKAIYSLTEEGIELLPLLMEMVAWANKHLPAAKLRGLAQILEEGGPELRGRIYD